MTRALWILTLPLEPSPRWTRAPVPLLVLLLQAAGVEVVSAPNREGTRDPLKHLLSAGSLSKHHVWNNTNGRVHEHLRLLRPRFRKLQRFGIAHVKIKKNHQCPTSSVSRLRAAVCRIFAHFCPSYTSLAFALLPFFLVNLLICLLYTSPSPRDGLLSRMPSSA